MFKKLVTFFTLVSVAFAGLMAVATPATADPVSSDATLSNLWMAPQSDNEWYRSSSYVMSPGFNPGQSFYEAFSPFQDVNIYANAADPNASVTLTGGDQTAVTVAPDQPVLVHFPAKANNPVVITVTATDGSSKTYTVNMSNVVLPQPEIVSYSPTSTSTAGGQSGVAYVKHLYNWVYYGNGVSCDGRLRYSYKYTAADGSTQTDTENLTAVSSAPDANGIVKVYTWSYGTPYSFRNDSAKADIIAQNGCFLADPKTANWYGPSAESLIPKAISFFNPTVNSVDAPKTLSQMSVIKVSGTGISAQSSVETYLLNPATGGRLYLRTRWIDNNNYFAYVKPDYYAGPEWNDSAKVKLVIDQVRYEGEEGVAELQNLFVKDVDFTPEVPTQVVLTPSKGPLAGGNTVKISGHHLCNYEYEEEPVIYIDGKEVNNLSEISGCDEDTWMSSSDGRNFDGIDRFSFTVPAGTKVGAADVSINIGYGVRKVGVKYNYGAKPTVATISPSSVANTGGSLLTITGTGFGTSGTPTVTINGAKSPSVLRISDTKLLAMVPADSATGAVEVNVISASGGGAVDVPSTINLVAPTVNPVVKQVSPSSGGVAGGDQIVISGTGFDAAATGVTIGGVPAKVTAATTTSITVETPTADVAGVVNVVVGTPTGIATASNAFSYTATPGVTSVSPSTIKTTDVGDATKVTITGVGLGASGTISVGGKTAVNYTATNGGTTISGVAIPTSAVGSVSIAVTPKGAKAPFTTSVRVVGPQISYVGSDPYDSSYGQSSLSNDAGWIVPATSTVGGDVIRIQGKNFGSAGTVKVGTLTVTPTSYTDTVVLFKTPALAVGTYDVSVVPNTGSIIATKTAALNVGPVVSGVKILSIGSSVDNQRGADRNTYDPVLDSSDLFTIKGTGFLANDNGASTTVYTQVAYQGEWTAIKPESVTNTEITFSAPKTYPVLTWVSVKVVTKVDYASESHGIYYVGIAPQPTTMVPDYGLCLKSSVGGFTPAVIVASGPAAFGDSGTVSIDGTNIEASAVQWSADQVTISFANLTSDLANPWGAKKITFTPADSSVPAQTWNFTCGVIGSVTTKLNGSVDDLTIAAGMPYSASADWNVSVPGTTYTEPASGYYYQSASDYNIWPMNQNVQSGLPVAAGEWYIWANTGAATWDQAKYIRVDASNVVHLTITGNPVTITPKLSSGNGNTKVYSGQLGDGTSGSSSDITYDATQTADPITSVSYEYRNHQCALADPNTGWNAGLPNSVAISPSSCGGDDTTVTSWEIRVANFQMSNGGTDRSIYYLATRNIFELTITKKALTLSAVKVEKVYDGSNSVTLGDITVSGAIEGDSPTLDPSFAAGAAFLDPTVGNNKEIQLAGPFQLSSGSATNYYLTNPDYVVTGNIKKADAVLSVIPSQSAVILGVTPTVELTVTANDSRTGSPISPDAGAADPLLVSKSPQVCSISGTTVSIIAAGECVIDASQAASTNYNAAASFRDSTSNIEEFTIKVYAAPKQVSVVADDLQVPVGEQVNPTYLATGLLDGDSYDNVEFQFYQGATLINGVPTEVGTYKIVPFGGNFTAADTLAYLSDIKYVAGKLVITPTPPAIEASTPAHGPEAGGNTLVITGSGLDTVTSINFGDVTIRKSDFVVNGDGTELSLVVPAGTGAVVVTLNAGPAQVATDYSYDPGAENPAPLNINLVLKLKIGAKFAGQPVLVTGGGLKANSQYVLVMHSKTQLIYKSITDSNGDFRQTVIIPGKACLAAGRHDLTLTGISPAGEKVTSVGYFYLDDQCHVVAQAVQSGSKTWTLSGFLFDFLQPTLTTKGVKSLKALSKFIKGAKRITIFGYTETDTKSKYVKAKNIILAQGRCNSVRAYLRHLGIKAKFVTVAKGGVNPVSLKHQYMNRRVVIVADY